MCFILFPMTNNIYKASAFCLGDGHLLFLPTKSQTCLSILSSEPSVIWHGTIGIYSEIVQVPLLPSGSIPPVLRVKSGETISFDCLDASNGQITPASSASSIAALEISTLDQVNGPVYVENAAPLLETGPSDIGRGVCITPRVGAVGPCVDFVGLHRHGRSQ